MGHAAFVQTQRAALVRRGGETNARPRHPGRRPAARRRHQAANAQRLVRGHREEHARRQGGSCSGEQTILRERNYFAFSSA